MAVGVGMKTVANFEEQLKKWNRPNFWQHLHLQDPAKFVFGNNVGLIIDDPVHMDIVKDISTEFHRNLLRERDALMSQSPAPLDDVTYLDIYTDLKKVFNPTNNLTSDLHFFLDLHLFQEIIGGTAKRASLSKVRETIYSRFVRLFSKYRQYIGERAVEMLVERFVQFLRETVVQLWSLRRMSLQNEYFPSPDEFYRDAVARSVSFFGVFELIRRVQRNENTVSMVIEISRISSAELSNLVFDPLFSPMFPPQFVRAFGNWLKTFRERIRRFYVFKLAVFCKLKVGKPVTPSQVALFCLDALAELLNDDQFMLFDDRWAEHFKNLLVELNICDPDEQMEKELKMDEFQNVLIHGNSRLCSQLSHIYTNPHIQEQRSVLAHLFRFVLRFSADFVRHCFSMQIGERGKLYFVYDGQFEELGFPGAYVAMDGTEEDYVQKLRKDEESANIESGTEPQTVYGADSSLPEVPLDSDPFDDSVRSSEEDLGLLTPDSLDSSTHFIFPPPHYFSPNPFDPYSARKPSTEAVFNQCHTQISNRRRKALSHLYPTPPTSPEPLHVPLVSSSNCNNFTAPRESRRDRRQNKKHRRNVTPVANARFMETEEEENEENLPFFDNNSNQMDNFAGNTQGCQIPLWIMYNYPLIETCNASNNENPQAMEN
ncbi:unnamed protein product [Caenorhabditis sp. 36 PRJEB53466]|nr:unnamed protein product [Caenorhabditis sp. 36 PRJEB53466]